MVWAAEWSADGRWVAYETPSERVPNDSPQPIVLWVVGPSQEPRQVATGVKPGYHPVPALTWTWSPTGAELATIDGSALSMIDPVTGETHNVGPFPQGVGDVTFGLAWSPDGTRFLFGARGGALYSIDARSGARSLLVRLPGEHLDSVDQIVWSPEGAHIAVMNDLDPGGGRVYVMDADGSMSWSTTSSQGVVGQDVGLVPRRDPARVRRRVEVRWEDLDLGRADGRLRPGRDW